MNSFAEKSLPPSDRQESPSADQNLVAALKATGLSNAEIGRGISYSSGAVSTYLSGKYEGNFAKFETAAREWLRDRTVAAVTGVPTIDTAISRTMREALEAIRKNSELALIIGPAGIGKSRGGGLYLIDHTLAVAFRALPWRTGMNAIAEDLSKAAGINRLAKGEKRWDAILDRTRGSGRLLIVDDAQELAPRALQCCVDYHEETGNPVCLIGLPSLKKKLLTDARRARRVDRVVELTIGDPTPMLNHLLDQFAADANGDRPQLLKLCATVASGLGAFGAVEKQLKYAARAHRKETNKTWPELFRAAHNLLLRDRTLN